MLPPTFPTPVFCRSFVKSYQPRAPSSRAFRDHDRAAKAHHTDLRQDRRLTCERVEGEVQQFEILELSK